MSICVAIVCGNHGMIATDGRVLGNDGSIADDSRDKTFLLPKSGIVGAHAGLMEISGASVGSYLHHLESQLTTTPASLDSTLDRLIGHLQEAVQLLPYDEVALPHRIIDLLFIGKQARKSQSPELRGARLEPTDTGHLRYTIRPFSPYAVIGDDAAKSAVEPMLEEKLQLFPRMKPVIARDLLRTVIQAGIAASGRDHRQRIQRCGGQPFYRPIP
jgi:hypothetical protein